MNRLVVIVVFATFWFDLSAQCLLTEINRLKNENLKSQFFRLIDSTVTKQYPNNDKEQEIPVDIEPWMLDSLMVCVDNSDRELESIECALYFNISPKEFSDSTVCKDKIILHVMSSCVFRLEVHNSFYVENDSNWFCTESMVVYSFKIEDDKVLLLMRQEAG